MKILYFTDAHLRGNNPISRKDDYVSALEAKFDEIGFLIQKHNVKIVLQGGDLFHTPAPSYSIVTNFAKRMKNWNVPIYSIIGSHDKFGYNNETLHRTALGILDASNITTYLDNPREIEPGVYICGTSHSYELDTNPKNYYKKKPKNCKYMIQITHGMLLEFPFFDKYTLIKDVQTEADLVITGHYHPGYAPVTCNGTNFFNIGSLGRIERTGRTFPPAIAIIDTETTKVEIITLKNVKEDVFTEKRVDEPIINDIDEFISNLKSRIGTLETYDVKSLIVTIGEQEGVSPQIIEKALKYIE